MNCLPQASHGYCDLASLGTPFEVLRRARRHKVELSLEDLKNIETRASSAYRELKEAWHFQHVIPSHDGEDSDNWEAFYYPIGACRCAHARLKLPPQRPPIFPQWP